MNNFERDKFCEIIDSISKTLTTNDNFINFVIRYSEDLTSEVFEDIGNWSYDKINWFNDTDQGAWVVSDIGVEYMEKVIEKHLIDTKKDYNFMSHVGAAQYEYYCDLIDPFSKDHKKYIMLYQLPRCANFKHLKDTTDLLTIVSHILEYNYPDCDKWGDFVVQDENIISEYLGY